MYLLWLFCININYFWMHGKVSKIKLYILIISIIFPLIMELLFPGYGNEHVSQN